MKTMKTHSVIIAVLTSAMAFTSCLNDNYDEVNNSIAQYTDFKFQTTQELKVSVKTLSNTNAALSGVHVELYAQNPLDANGVLLENRTMSLLFKGLTDGAGSITATVATATSNDSVYALVNYIGLENMQVQKVNTSGEMSYVFGGNQSSAQNVARKVAAASGGSQFFVTNFWKVNDLYAIANWNNKGVPANLVSPNDVITSDLLADINASLPEGSPLTKTHPEYLESNDDGSIVLIEDAEVWVTFVHEGAGYTNSLAYYSYPTATPPATKAAIKYNTIAFPNVSFNGSGGGLTSGNKVQLLYFDEANNRYTNVFPAGTSVSWMIRSNGWSGNTVGNGSYNYYSNTSFNPESNASLRKHNIMLKDDKRKLLLIGLEDLKRDNGSDEDFNDAVFYATVTPYTAVKTGIYKSIDTPVDTDGDGVSDAKDEYPTDPERAYNNYYPAKNVKGTLAFEDLWPYKGDYDFNDMVVDYNFNQITNAANKVVDIDATFNVRAIGAHYHNGFALLLNTPADNVKSVTGQLMSTDLFTLNSNKTESGVSNAVIPVFDNAYRTFYASGSGAYVNVINGSAYQEPRTLNVKVSFSTPVSTTQLGSAPFNPFIVVDQTRSKEVHLPGYAPTEKMDMSLFGKGQDNSNPATGKYYMSDNYLPWGLNIPVQFDYPAEGHDITKAHLKFNLWAVSRGNSYTDWYTNKAGYRNTTELYSK